MALTRYPLNLEDPLVSRYFFRVRDSSGFVEEEDPKGTECPDEASLKAEAVESARDVMAEYIRQGLDVSSWSYEVVDEHDRPVLTLPFSEAVRRV